MDIVEIKLEEPSDKIYLSVDTLKHIIETLEESPFVFKDCLKNKKMTFTLLKGLLT